MGRLLMEVIWYKTANKCLAAFHQCKVSELPSKGWWEYCDRNGEQCRMSVKEAKEEINKKGCWGWCENKETLHLWISSRASLLDAIELIAHELGHCERPYYFSSSKEEKKASVFGKVAYDALNILVDKRGLKLK